MFVSFVDPSDGVHSKVSEATCFEAIEAYMRFGSGSFQMTVTSTTTGKTVRGRVGSVICFSPRGSRIMTLERSK
jgi:hypothetical protein